MYFKNFTIGYFFEKNEIQKIAIYGWGEAGKYLYELLISEKVEVIYALDRNSFPQETKIKIYSKFENLPDVDMVVVTAIKDYVFIQEKLVQYLKCPIISMDDIVAICKRDLMGRSNGNVF